METKTEERARNWTAIIYPESMPENYEQILSDIKVPTIISPLHDNDIKEDGSLKKPHYHIVILYSSKKSYEQVKNDLSPLGGTIPQRIKDTKATVRYLIHKDNKEKAQYNQEDIRLLNGASTKDWLNEHKEKGEIYDEIIDFIEENDITEFCDLVTFCRYNKPEWKDIMYTSYTIFFNSYLTSRRNKKKEMEK